MREQASSMNRHEDKEYARCMHNAMCLCNLKFTNQLPGFSGEHPQNAPCIHFEATHDPSMRELLLIAYDVHTSHAESFSLLFPRTLPDSQSTKI